jgi:DNA polymerase/3'-5' exonuclease PolX
MNSTSITDYILKLEKENEQLKNLVDQANHEKAGALEKLNAKLLEDEIRRVGAVLNESSLFDTTARTKTFEINRDIANHLRKLGEMTSDFYKTAAYQRAADIVATLDHEVENGESLMNIKGIGKSIAARIDDFINEYYTDAESVASNEGQIIESDDESDDEFFVSYNSELADILDELAYHEEDEYKSRAYDKAASMIDRLPFKVTSGRELMKVDGIGKSIAKIIDEFITTGKVEKLEKGASTNEEVARALDDYADNLKDMFKVRAYKNAAKNIRTLDFEVTCGQELCTGPTKVKGIGKSIANRIDTFLQTGEINP